MPLTDYAEILDRLQKSLAARYVQSPELLNAPGRSLADKIDQNYYLCVEPLFTTNMAKLSGVFPETVVETMTRTGNIITRPGDRAYTLDLEVAWDEGRKILPVQACFVLADFVERALALYAEAAKPTLSDLRIPARERANVEAFFQGKTPPSKWVYLETES